jgi:hypothetical protein
MINYVFVADVEVVFGGGDDFWKKLREFWGVLIFLSILLILRRYRD